MPFVLPRLRKAIDIYTNVNYFDKCINSCKSESTHCMVKTTCNFPDIDICDGCNVTISIFLNEYIHFSRCHFTLVLHLITSDKIFSICVVTWQKWNKCYWCDCHQIRKWKSHAIQILKTWLKEKKNSSGLYDAMTDWSPISQQLLSQKIIK